jgi:hypothetical protein
MCQEQAVWETLGPSLHSSELCLSHLDGRDHPTNHHWTFCYSLALHTSSAGQSFFPRRMVTSSRSMPHLGLSPIGCSETKQDSTVPTLLNNLKQGAPSPPAPRELACFRRQIQKQTFLCNVICILLSACSSCVFGTLDTASWTTCEPR